jgi:hypothetical protein
MNLEIKKGEYKHYKKIIIKYDDKITFTYSLNTYNEHNFLKNFISKNKFTDILDKANIIIFSAKMKKAKFDKVEINKITYVLIFISFIFTIIFIFLFYYAPRNKTNQTKMKIFGIIFFCLAIIILIIIEIFFSAQKIYGDKTLFQFYKKDMKKYIEKINKKWKNVMFFKFDKISKDIICFVNINKDNEDNLSKSFINTKVNTE